MAARTKGSLWFLLFHHLILIQLSSQKSTYYDLKSTFHTPDSKYDDLEILERSNFEASEAEKLGKDDRTPQAYANAQVMLHINGKDDKGRPQYHQVHHVHPAYSTVPQYVDMHADHGGFKGGYMIPIAHPMVHPGVPRAPPMPHHPQYSYPSHVNYYHAKPNFGHYQTGYETYTFPMHHFDPRKMGASNPNYKPFYITENEKEPTAPDAPHPIYRPRKKHHKGHHTSHSDFGDEDAAHLHPGYHMSNRPLHTKAKKPPSEDQPIYPKSAEDEHGLDVEVITKPKQPKRKYSHKPSKPISSTVETLVDPVGGGELVHPDYEDHIVSHLGKRKLNNKPTLVLSEPIIPKKKHQTTTTAPAEHSDKVYNEMINSPTSSTCRSMEQSQEATSELPKEESYEASTGVTSESETEEGEQLCSTEEPIKSRTEHAQPIKQIIELLSELNDDENLQSTTDCDVVSEPIETSTSTEYSTEKSITVPCAESKTTAPTITPSAAPCMEEQTTTYVRPTITEPCTEEQTTTYVRPTITEPCTEEQSTTYVRPTITELCTEEQTTTSVRPTITEPCTEEQATTYVRPTVTEPCTEETLTTSTTSAPCTEEQTTTSVRPTITEPCTEEQTTTSVRPTITEPCTEEQTTTSVRPTITEPYTEEQTTTSVRPTITEPCTEAQTTTSVRPTTTEPCTEEQTTTSVRPTITEPCTEEQTTTTVKPTVTVPCTEEEVTTSTRPTTIEPCTETQTTTSIRPTTTEPCTEETTTSTTTEPCTETQTTTSVRPTITEPCTEEQTTTSVTPTVTVPCTEEEVITSTRPTTIEPCLENETTTPIVITEPCTDDEIVTSIRPTTGEPCTEQQIPTTTEPCTEQQNPTITEPCTEQQNPTTTEPCTEQQEPTTTEPCTEQQEPTTTEPCTEDVTTTTAETCTENEATTSNRQTTIEPTEESTITDSCETPTTTESYEEITSKQRTEASSSEFGNDDSFEFPLAHFEQISKKLAPQAQTKPFLEESVEPSEAEEIYHSSLNSRGVIVAEPVKSCIDGNCEFPAEINYDGCEPSDDESCKPSTTESIAMKQDPTDPLTYKEAYDTPKDTLEDQMVGSRMSQEIYESPSLLYEESYEEPTVMFEDQSIESSTKSTKSNGLPTESYQDLTFGLPTESLDEISFDEIDEHNNNENSKTIVDGEDKNGRGRSKSMPAYVLEINDGENIPISITTHEDKNVGKSKALRGHVININDEEKIPISITTHEDKNVGKSKVWPGHVIHINEEENMPIPSYSHTGESLEIPGGLFDDHTMDHTTKSAISTQLPTESFDVLSFGPHDDDQEHIEISNPQTTESSVINNLPTEAYGSFKLPLDTFDEKEIFPEIADDDGLGFSKDVGKEDKLKVTKDPHSIEDSSIHLARNIGKEKPWSQVSMEAADASKEEATTENNAVETTEITTEPCTDNIFALFEAEKEAPADNSIETTTESQMETTTEPCDDETNYKDFFTVKPLSAEITFEDNFEVKPSGKETIPDGHFTAETPGECTTSVDNLAEEPSEPYGPQKTINYKVVTEPCEEEATTDYKKLTEPCEEETTADYKEIIKPDKYGKETTIKPKDLTELCKEETTTEHEQITEPCEEESATEPFCETSTAAIKEVSEPCVELVTLIPSERAESSQDGISTSKPFDVYPWDSGESCENLTIEESPELSLDTCENSEEIHNYTNEELTLNKSKEYSLEHNPRHYDGTTADIPHIPKDQVKEGNMGKTISKHYKDEEERSRTAATTVLPEVEHEETITPWNIIQGITVATPIMKNTDVDTPAKKPSMIEVQPHQESLEFEEPATEHWGTATEFGLSEEATTESTIETRRPLDSTYDSLEEQKSRQPVQIIYPGLYDSEESLVPTEPISWTDHSGSDDVTTVVPVPCEDSELPAAPPDVECVTELAEGSFSDEGGHHGVFSTEEDSTTLVPEFERGNVPSVIEATLANQRGEAPKSIEASITDTSQETVTQSTPIISTMSPYKPRKPKTVETSTVIATINGEEEARPSSSGVSVEASLAPTRPHHWNHNKIANPVNVYVYDPDHEKNGEVPAMPMSIIDKLTDYLESYDRNNGFNLFINKKLIEKEDVDKLVPNVYVYKGDTHQVSLKEDTAKTIPSVIESTIAAAGGSELQDSQMCRICRDKIRSGGHPRAVCSDCKKMIEDAHRNGRSNPKEAEVQPTQSSPTFSSDVDALHAYKAPQSNLKDIFLHNQPTVYSDNQLVYAYPHDQIYDILRQPMPAYADHLHNDHYQYQYRPVLDAQHTPQYSPHRQAQLHQPQLSHQLQAQVQPHFYAGSQHPIYSNYGSSYPMPQYYTHEVPQYASPHNVANPNGRACPNCAIYRGELNSVKN